MIKRSIIIVAAVLAGTAAQAQNAEVEAAWSRMVDMFVSNGSRMERTCFPKQGTCTRALSMQAADGNLGMLIGLETATGTPRFERRVMCKFNEARDGRECVTFETGRKFRQVFDNRRKQWGPEIPVDAR